MFGHQREQLVVTQLLPRHMLAISIFLDAQHIAGLESGLIEELFQTCRRERLLQIIDAFKLDSLFSQDPLDFAALASSRLIIDNYLFVLRHDLLLLS